MIIIEEEFTNGVQITMGYRDDRGHFITHAVGEPAIVYKPHHGSGHVSWFLNGAKFYYVETYCMGCDFDEMTTMMWLLKYGDKLPRHEDQL